MFESNLPKSMNVRWIPSYIGYFELEKKKPNMKYDQKLYPALIQYTQKIIIDPTSGKHYRFDLHKEYHFHKPKFSTPDDYPS